ncbi:MAG TPA: phosphoribosyltransferase family protein [Micropepsaceae bacterium]|nr:phosphoribosyltransferase family protein [Micropepsaceae bacterium]
MQEHYTERTLFSPDQIAQRIDIVAREIAARSVLPEVAVPVLAGAFVFAADLMRTLASLGLELETDFIWLRSYGRSQNPGELQILRAPGETVRGRSVLLIDGVLDRGATLAAARKLLDAAGATSIISAVAVVKAAPDPLFRADYALFHAGSEFLYGYGMDWSGHGRGLPDIRVRT